MIHKISKCTPVWPLLVALLLAFDVWYFAGDVKAQSVATPPTRLREWTFGTTTTTPIPFTSLAITVNGQTKYPQSILVGNTGPTTLTFNLEATASATVTSGGSNLSIFPGTQPLSYVNIDGVWKGMSVVRPDSVNGTVTAWCSY